MTDPKMGLTKFVDVYAAKSAVAVAGPGGGQLGAGAPGAAGGGFVAPAQYGSSALSLAASDTLHEDDQGALFGMVAQYSISSVEELLAVSRLSSGDGPKLLKRAGIPEETVNRIREGYAATPQGEAEVADWARYERLTYTTGFDLDLNNPPADPVPQLGAAAAPAAAVAAGIAAPVAPPIAAVSLIDEYMSAIQDQGARGTCTAFSSIACLEYYQRRFGGHKSNLSEEFAYWDMVHTTGAHALGPMFQLLQSNGTCTERTWPYWPQEIPGNDAQDPPPPHAVQKAVAYRPNTVLQLSPRDVNAIKGAIAAFHVVAIGIPVYPSWYESAVVRKYGNITVPLPGEVPENIGHAVALVGYEDNVEYAGGGYFIVRNSWGQNWATEGAFGPGYGTIPYRYITNFNWDAWHVAS
jgi:hypothetical protein